ncbi:hypothetical protein H4R33_003844 [Dimargaris cristalligena]|uniref:SCP domain-containing protein n=1 Tax=Dimargaris cristalligena TaxID=215637 RepID=A0A4P9ZQ27_9FUNG|nr:hypothetical protein H4R33_003844 [Dimargaris cristalligena]RKP34722.1 hypothetical protein BJ085DRAFT_37740 [Dimargaris cristalligena]|eukprot:RKP34722.1 hypothetical protein BJ085DRAFT_37740 [Dimargaris cristalligena]
MKVLNIIGMLTLAVTINALPVPLKCRPHLSATTSIALDSTTVETQTPTDISTSESITIPTSMSPALLGYIRPQVISNTVSSSAAATTATIDDESSSTTPIAAESSTSVVVTTSDSTTAISMTTSSSAASVTPTKAAQTTTIATSSSVVPVTTNETKTPEVISSTSAVSVTPVVSVTPASITPTVTKTTAASVTPLVTKTTPVAVPTSTPVSPPVASSGNTADNQLALKLVNTERAKKSLPALIYDATLEKMALAHTKYMETSGKVTHDDPSGSMSVRMDALGKTWTSIAENVAGGQTTEQEVMDSWIASPGHYANIMSTDNHRIAIARVGNMWTQNFAAYAGDF